MSPLQNIILLAAKIHPTAEELEALNAQLPLVVDWEEVVRNLIERGVGPLFYSKIKLLSNGKFIPDDAVDKLKQSYYLTLSRGMVMYSVFRKAVETLKTNGIEVIALKGVYLAEMLYGDIALRQFSDIDLLIKEEDGAKSKTMLKKAGFKSSKSLDEVLEVKNNVLHYPPVILNNVSVELHLRLHKYSESYNIQTDSVWNNSIPTTIQGLELKVPDLIDMLIHVCVHLDKHFIYGDVAFTCFHDIVNLLDVFKDKLEWDKIKVRCTEYKCEAIVFKYLILVNYFYQVSLPDKIIKEYGSLISNKDKKLFTKYLGGYRSIFSLPVHLNAINFQDDPKNKMRYILAMLFPSKNFMTHTYKIKNPSLYWCYYPYRYWIGLKGLWRMIKNAL